MRKSVLAVAALTFLAACERVDETEHCIETRYGNVTNDHVAPGITATVTVDLTCFPLVEQNYPENSQAKEVIENAVTRDSTIIAGDVALTWQYNPGTLLTVFKAKRRPEAVLFEITNALRDGFRSAVATQTTESLLGPQRASFDTVVKNAVQKKLGNMATINKVFIRGIVLPASLTQSRERIVKQAADLREATNAREIAEANAAAQIAAARGQAESQRLLAASYAQNPKVLDLEIAKAYAKALESLCPKGGNATCIIGASTLDGLLGRGN